MARVSEAGLLIEQARAEGEFRCDHCEKVLPFKKLRAVNGARARMYCTGCGCQDCGDGQDQD